MAFLAATENGTKFGGAGGMVTFDNDRWRWRGGVGLADVNLDFFGAGGVLGTAERSIGYNLDGLVSSQQVMYRFGQSSNFIAGRWIYLDLKSRFDLGRPQPVLPPHAERSSGWACPSSTTRATTSSRPRAAGPARSTACSTPRSSAATTSLAANAVTAASS